MERIDLQGVSETMLQTLYARAVHSKQPDHKFYDAKAIEIVKQLDYDFSKVGKDKVMSADGVGEPSTPDDSHAASHAVPHDCVYSANAGTFRYSHYGGPDRCAAP